jgi:hypothetical protein
MRKTDARFSPPMYSVYQTRLTLVPLIAGRLPLPQLLLDGGVAARGGGVGGGCVSVAARRDSSTPLSAARLPPAPARRK